MDKDAELPCNFVSILRAISLLIANFAKRLLFFIPYGNNNSSKSNKEGFMRITTKGQVTIPLEIREKMGFLPDTDVEFVMNGKNVCLKKIERQSRRSRSLIARLRGKGTVRMTTDEIMTLTRG
jgi:AbrB family looped-hinge helix DNA binding protein